MCTDDEQMLIQLMKKMLKGSDLAEAETDLLEAGRGRCNKRKKGDDDDAEEVQVQSFHFRYKLDLCLPLAINLTLAVVLTASIQPHLQASFCIR